MMIAHSHDYTPREKSMFGDRQNRLICVRRFYEGSAASESEEINRRGIRNHGLGWANILGGFFDLMGLLAILGCSSLVEPCAGGAHRRSGYRSQVERIRLRRGLTPREAHHPDLSRLPVGLADPAGLEDGAPAPRPEPAGRNKVRRVTVAATALSRGGGGSCG